MVFSRWRKESSVGGGGGHNMEWDTVLDRYSAE